MPAVQDTRTTKTSWAIAVVNALTGIVIALCLLRVWINLSGIPLVPQDNAWVPPESLPQILNLQLGPDPATTEITALPVWLRALGTTSTVAMTVMLVIVFRTVHLLARRSAEGRPFAADVIRRLRRASSWLLVLIILRLLIDVATITALNGWFPSAADSHGGGALGTDLPALSLNMLVAAAVAGVLAQAFHRGRQLSEDTDGLV